MIDCSQKLEVPVDLHRYLRRFQSVVNTELRASLKLDGSFVFRDHRHRNSESLLRQIAPSELVENKCFIICRSPVD